MKTEKVTKYFLARDMFQRDRAIFGGKCELYHYKSFNCCVMSKIENRN